MTRNNFKPPAILLPHTIPQEICIAYEQGLSVVCTPFGGVAERLNAPVLKTGDGRPSVGSNPTSSAIHIAQPIDSVGLFCIRDFWYASEYAIRCWLSYPLIAFLWTAHCHTALQVIQSKRGPMALSCYLCCWSVQTALLVLLAAAKGTRLVAANLDGYHHRCSLRCARKWACLMFLALPFH